MNREKLPCCQYIKTNKIFKIVAHSSSINLMSHKIKLREGMIEQKLSHETNVAKHSLVLCYKHKK